MKTEGLLKVNMVQYAFGSNFITTEMDVVQRGASRINAFTKWNFREELEIAVFLTCPDIFSLSLDY